MMTPAATFTDAQIDAWWAYERVRKSGLINMFDAKRGAKLSGITRDEYMFCIKHYSALKEQAENGMGK